MNMRLGVLLALVSCFASTAARAQVRIVAPQAQQGSFTNLQLAITAAQDGDTLLVRGGTHGDVILDGKSLTIVSVFGDAVVEEITVSNLAEDQSVTLVGLAQSGNGVLGQGTKILECAGRVELVECSLVGSKGTDYFEGDGGDGSPGLRVRNSPAVVLSKCTVRGGPGGSGGFDSSQTQSGGAGGAGLQLDDSTILVEDSTLFGGVGGPGGFGGVQGFGGIGLNAQMQGASTELVLSGCSLFGGAGIFSTSGMALGSGTVCYVLDSSIVTGTIGAGQLLLLPAASHRSFSTSARAVSDETPWTLTAQGAAGDTLWLLRSLVPAFQLSPRHSGILLAPYPLPMTVQPLGVLSGSGSTFTVHPSQVPAGQGARLWNQQAWVQQVDGKQVLSGALPLLVLDRDGGVDCNANGINDVVEVLEGTAADVDGDLIPDGCSWTGPSWFVDDDAPAGGDGSPTFPFDNLAQALEKAQNGHEVLVADGLYTGPLNRRLSTNGKAIVVRSENGPADCIIDCESQGRAFTFFNSGETADTRIVGLTMIHGLANSQNHPQESSPYAGGAVLAQNCSPTIEGCVFEENVALTGGAVSLFFSNSIVRGCEFRRNVAEPQGAFNFSAGGAIQAIGESPSIVECLIADNESRSASGAGGVDLSLGGNSTNTMHLVNSVLRGNRAFAGAIQGTGAASTLKVGNMTNMTSVAGQVRIQGCTMLDGGGTGIDGINPPPSVLVDVTNSPYSVVIEGSTIVAPAGPAGWALSVRGAGSGSTQELRLRNSIVWGSPAGGAEAIAILDAGPLIEIDHSNVVGGRAGVLGALQWGAGNLNADPLFVDADGPDDDPATWWNNLFLLDAGSPCVDAGSNLLVLPDVVDVDGDLDVLEANPLDVFGFQRFVDDPLAPDTGAGTAPLVDMGAHERQ